MFKRKILIVDDEAPVRTLLVSVLSAPGVEIVEAEDANHALAIAAQHRYFDLVITDLSMPGMSGIELAQRLREARWARHFLFVSGFAQINSVELVLEEFERAEFLNKPFSMIELLRIVNSLCEPPPSPAMESLHRTAGA
jgi:CheY-like chemotaxis protein